MSALAGVAAAMAGAGVFSLILAYGATAFRGDPVVIGIGMNLLASGLTAYLLQVVFGVSGTFSDPGRGRPRSRNDSARSWACRSWAGRSPASRR